MRRFMLAVMMVAGLGGTAWAQEAALPTAPLPICPGGVSLQEDPTRPGVILASYEDLPRFGTDCTPYAGVVYWHVMVCVPPEGASCFSFIYVSNWPRRRYQTMAFRPELIGQHNVYARIKGLPDEAQPISAMYRKR